MEAQSAVLPAAKKFLTVGKKLAATVTISDNGRDGRVQYSEGARTISGYWEFGGRDVVAIVSMGSREDWQRAHSWALDQRTAILRFVADEVVRRRAPSCSAEIDEPRGDILLRQRGPATAGPSPHTGAPSFVRSLTNLKALFGQILLIVSLVVGGMLWMGKKVLFVAPANGVPLNACVRTDSHIASLIQYTDPHLPQISGRGGNTTTSVSILLIPLDGREPQLVPVVGKLPGNSLSLARILGSDGHTLWFDAGGPFGVRLSDYELITQKDLPVMPNFGNGRFDKPGLTDFMAAGFLTGPGSWFGVLSPDQLESEYKPGQWVRPVESTVDARQQRRLFSGETESSSADEHQRIRSMAPLGDAEFLNAAFLRMGKNAAPLRLTSPDGVLMIFTSASGLQGTLIVARVDLHGRIVWTVDTGLHRFLLQQILPGTDAFAFVGTRPPIPDRLSEPLVVLVDNRTGKLTSHSLWR